MADINFGRNLAVIMCQRRIKLKDLAHRINSPTSNLGLIRAGKTLPSYTTMVKLCVALEISPNELMGNPVREATNIQTLRSNKHGNASKR